jgi:hypothetical protein
MGNPKNYGVIQYLDDSFLDDYSFPVKNFTTKLFPISFFRVVDIREHQDNMCAAKKTPNKIWFMV